DRTAFKVGRSDMYLVHKKGANDPASRHTDRLEKPNHPAKTSRATRVSEHSPTKADVPECRP
ncbi:hypothetical protein, partial [Salmonella enterica]|uniref:hypothetical protein n=1 Tax=Salmonella enterica TaxID=28901 RepID=UPI0039EB3DC2